MRPRPLPARALIVTLAFLALASCHRAKTPDAAQAEKPAGASGSGLEEVATSTRQWTGVAVAHDGSVFVTFPRWSADVPISVGRLAGDGSVSPVPDAAHNAWTPGADPATAWVSAQAVHVDRSGSLWVVDPANPMFAGVVPGGAKLVEMDPRTLEIRRTIVFDASVAPAASYMNDVRVDVGRGAAYLTDSGLGALVVVDLATGTARRVLADHPATRSEGTTLSWDGQPFLMPDGSKPEVHADGIALAPDGQHLYWHALTGTTLWRIETAALRDASLDDAALGARVERVATTPACDGMAFGFDGTLYLTALQESAIVKLMPDGTTQEVVRDARLAWPDSLALRADGALYMTTAQIHRGFGGEPPEPYRLLRLRP